jgi:hypothetical protein
MDVVGEAPFAAHKDRILAAEHRLADAEFGDSPAVWVVLQIHAASSADAVATEARGCPQLMGKSRADKDLWLSYAMLVHLLREASTLLHCWRGFEHAAQSSESLAQEGYR